MIKKGLKEIKRLIDVSKGDAPPKLFIEAVDILDVYGAEVYRGNIWVCNAWIAYVGDKRPVLSKDTEVINGKGKLAVPGYVDAHGHADLFYNPATFADFAVTRGTTTVFSDSQDMLDSITISGFLEVLKVSDGFALKYLWSVPASYPPYPDVEGGELFSFHDILLLFLNHRECLGISELSSYRRIIDNEDKILDRMLIARSLGKNIEGHTLGANYERLNTLAAAGITSCHEATNEAELRNRVRLGIYTMIRHSSIRSDFERLCFAAKDLPKDSIMLVSDGVFAEDLCTRGYMDFIIGDAMRLGINPFDAIKMCTLNPARYLKMDAEIGSITPGRIADILLLEDISQPRPTKVIERGRVVADKGELLIESSAFPDIRNRYNPYCFDSIGEEELFIERKGEGSVPVIEIVDKTVTKRVDVVLKKEGSLLLPNRDIDIRKVLYTRRDKKAWGKGFVKGIGANIGGIATTVAHETHGLLILGFDDKDMALAGNLALSMGGGIVLVDSAEVLYKLPLPEGAIMSILDIKALAAELKRFKEIMRERGSTLEDPLLSIVFLTLTSIIELRLTVSGLYDVKRGEIVF